MLYKQEQPPCMYTWNSHLQTHTCMYIHKYHCRWAVAFTDWYKSEFNIAKPWQRQWFSKRGGRKRGKEGGREGGWEGGMSKGDEGERKKTKGKRGERWHVYTFTRGAWKRSRYNHADKPASLHSSFKLVNSHQQRRYDNTSPTLYYTQGATRKLRVNKHHYCLQLTALYFPGTPPLSP